MEDNAPNNYLFSLSVAANHPSRTAATVCAMLDWDEPLNTWSVGDPKTTPKGTRLAGNRDFTLCVIRHEYLERHFGTRLKELVEQLQEKTDNLADFLGTGGFLSIRLGLNGCHNVGDDINPQLLSQMGALGISFTVEAFPFRTGGG